MDKRIQVIVPEQIFTMIQQKAIEEDRSISNFARKLILKGVENATSKNLS